MTKPKNFDEYIVAFPGETQKILQQLRETIKKAAPDSVEVISYGMPSFRQNGRLLYFAAFKNHIGFYPMVTGIEAFKTKLSSFKWAKGSVQFPLQKPLPLELITEIVKFRVNENLEKSKKTTTRITPCLWFDNEAEDAATYYVSIFKNSKIGDISRYGKEGFEFHGKPQGTALTVAFTINGQEFIALNGGPQFKFSEAISFEVFCETQEEIDNYWSKLTEEGSEGQCGWLKDKYGLSWQIVPAILPKLMTDPLKADRVIKAILQMKKLDIKTLIQA